ncbi:MAG: S8 family serine peptidase [Proteobacteria bacterium]|nr:S8 family serine peptidase [Pseudomonadota bacterium]
MPKTDFKIVARSILTAAALFAAPAALAQETGYPPGNGYYHDDPSGPETQPFLTPGQGRAPRVQTGDGGRYEWIVIGPPGEEEAVRRIIVENGGTIDRRGDLGALGAVQQIAYFPTEAARQRATEAIAALAPNSSLSWNHIYYMAQSASGPRVYAPQLIGDAGPGRCSVAGGITIGMIDGPVNTEHPALRGVNVTYETIAQSNRVPASNHGTAVAVLLVGEDPSGLLSGFARGARLHAISVFAETEEEPEANVERIAAAIDRLVANGVRLINFSLAGPPNEALGRAIAAAAARGVVMVGASGNERRPVVAWPAAAPEVIAVTAVDAARHRFRMANTGAELEFAAPGVDIYAAQARGARYVSGTSFAAPIVTALAARLMAQGRGSAEAVRAALRQGVEPLGPGSRNTDFGYGLVCSNGC